jgi:hypothetical protein
MKKLLADAIGAALILGALLVWNPGRVFAQGTGATLEGTIGDPSGAIMPGAIVTIKNIETGVDRSIVTNASGFYSAPALVPGKYAVNVSAQGFQTVVVPEIELTVGADEVLNLQMVIGQVGQKLEVRATASEIDLASSMVSHVVGATTIEELPLNGRDWTQLAQLQPGVAIMVSQDTATADRLQRGNGTQLSISGGRPSENNYRVNGISVNDYANTAPATSIGTNLGVDAVQEFSTLVGSFSAEYGRSSGGIVNAVTRSGTNSLHGSAYYFVRNSAFDARNFFDATPSAHAFRRNQYGGSVGGPIKKNKTFYFVDYEGLLSTLGVSGVGVVPSSKARSGLLSSGTITVNPAVKPFLAIYPLPNGPLSANGDTGSYFFDSPQKAHDNYIVGKVDQKFSTSDDVAFSYFSDAALLNTPDELANKFISFDSHNQSASAEWSHIFTPSLLNAFRVGFSRAVATQGLDLVILNPALKDTSLGFAPPAQGPAALVVGGLTSVSGGFNAYGDTAFWFTTTQLYDNVLYSKGIHSLKIGFNLERDRANSISSTNAQFTFGSLQTFLQGNPLNYNATLPASNFERGVRQTIFGTYAHDDVRVRANLTLNLGLRYEMATVPHEVNGLLAGLTSLTAPTTTVFNGSNGPIFYNPTLRNFEPRVGFAWDPFKNGKTSIRGGFAIYDILPLNYLFVNQFTRTPPFYQAGTLQTSNIPDVFPSGAYNLLTPATNRTVLIERHPRRPYKIERNITLQRELLPGTTISVAYVGANGLHLPVLDQDVDLVLPISTNPYRWAVPTTSSQRINPNFGRIGTTRWYGYSLYNGLQTTLQSRFGDSLIFQASYTFAKSTDNDSATFSNNEFLNDIGNPYPFDPNFNKGLSDFNVAHNFIFSETWSIPMRKHSSIRWLLGGWQLGNIFQARTGAPFTPLLNASQAGTQSSSAQNALGERPNFVNNPACADPTTGNPNAWFNVQCFTFPAAGTLGNLGRNTLTGPRFVNLDSSLFRNLSVPAISDSFRVQFRMEFFNLLNHSNFGMLVGRTGAVLFNSNGSFNSSAGQITATQNPSRQIQFGLKFLW